MFRRAGRCQPSNFHRPFLSPEADAVRLANESNYFFIRDDSHFEYSA